MEGGAQGRRRLAERAHGAVDGQERGLRIGSGGGEFFVDDKDADAGGIELGDEAVSVAAYGGAQGEEDGCLGVKEAA